GLRLAWSLHKCWTARMRRGLPPPVGQAGMGPWRPFPPTSVLHHTGRGGGGRQRIDHATPSSQAGGKCMQVKPRVKAGLIASNHNETLVRVPRPASALKVKTHVKAGGISANHNETLVRATGPTPSLKVKTGVKAGGANLNHNETLVRVPRPTPA